MLYHSLNCVGRGALVSSQKAVLLTESEGQLWSCWATQGESSSHTPQGVSYTDKLAGLGLPHTLVHFYICFEGQRVEVFIWYPESRIRRWISTQALHNLGNAAIDEAKDDRLYLHRAGFVKFRKRKGIPGHFWERRTLKTQHDSWHKAPGESVLNTL